MNSEKYRILIGDYVIAEKMELETALLLIESMFEKYYNESTGYTIEKMPKIMGGKQDANKSNALDALGVRWDGEQDV